MKIKAFIINRNLLTWPKNMVEWMTNHPDIEPIIIDNVSTYSPLLEWYDTNPCRIIKMAQNYKHKVLWTTGLFQSEVKENYYIVTDPDIDLSSVPYDVVDRLIEGIEKYNQPKVGLALKISDLPVDGPNTEQILKWESSMWSNPLENDFYAAPIDTTFALCSRERCRTHMIGGIRLGGEYTCRHLPFYLTPTNVTEEYDYYLKHREALDPDDINFRNSFNAWVDEAIKVKANG